MESMINKDFDSLPQRCVYYFLVTYPSFYPVKSDKADESEQKAAYDFILNIYKNLYDNSMLLKIKPVPDDFLNEWQPQKEKPGLAPKLRFESWDFSRLHKELRLARRYAEMGVGGTH